MNAKPSSAATTGNPTHYDRYPSRCFSTPRHQPRQDPVLHVGPGAAGPLSAEELAQFEREGFLLCPEVFTRGEIHALRAAMDQAARQDAERIAEPDSTEVRSLFALHRGDHLPARLMRDPRLVHRAEQLLGPGVYIHQSRANRKPAFDGREFWWHSDFETWHVEDGLPAMRALSAMVFLDDNTAAKGPLLVIPGSHHIFIACVGATPENHHAHSLRRQEYGIPDRDSLTLLAHDRGVQALCGVAGTVALFECNLLHGSAGNLSPLPRLNLFAVYNHIDNAPAAPFGGRPPRPLHVAERTAVAITASPLDLCV
jgi:ectoine hydroxylase